MDALAGGEFADDALRMVEQPPPITNSVNTGQRTGSAAYKSLNVNDKSHYFSDLVDNYACTGSQFEIRGGDGVARTLYQIEGTQGSKAGIFEWIVDGSSITHRRFIAGGKITGQPNQIVK